MYIYKPTEFGRRIPSGNAFSELGSIGTPLTTNGRAQYLDHLSVNTKCCIYLKKKKRKEKKRKRKKKIKKEKENKQTKPTMRLGKSKHY